MAEIKEKTIDGLFNYELHEEIRRGRTAIVYRATCKKGRLRNRLVAIKKIPRTYNGQRSTSENISSVVSLHAALCHPSIVSLISSFATPCDHYHVLELCQEGTLADLLHYRHPPLLAEEELRGVAKAMVDALVYLKKELVIHRDINPSKLAITNGRRIKLFGFDSALRLSTVDSTATEFCGSANYVSPEILSGRPYSFASDLWSLGCVLVTCLSGRAAFHAPTPDGVYDNICSVKYVLPESVSSEGQDLIHSILQKNPHDRALLHRIHSHPFFAPNLPIIPLELSPSSTTHPNPRCHGASESGSGRLHPVRRYPPHLSRDAARPRPTPKSPVKPKYCVPFKRAPLEDITNLYSDRSRDDEGVNLLDAPPSRVVSAPHAPTSYSLKVTQATDPDFVDDSHPPTPALTMVSPEIPPCDTQTLRQPRSQAVGPSSVPLEPSGRLSQHPSPRSQLRRVLSDSYSLPGSRRAISLGSSRPVLYPRHTAAPKERVSSQATSTTAVSHSRSPRRVTKPAAGPKPLKPLATSRLDRGHSAALTTHRLKPQTHKVSRGQLVVLPSRSILVDFREGERRKGGQGREVLVISPDGGTIEVYDAPHLSTPCCLAEASATYPLDHLPQQYHKMYCDAARLVDQLKSRIPKLVHYSDDAKCTLMANGPLGDIEILIPGDEDKKDAKTDAIRLRLQQKKCLLEISRYSGKSARGRKDLGEWTKKVVALGPGLDLAEEDEVALDDLERAAMRRLSEFLPICHVATSLVAAP